MSEHYHTHSHSHKHDVKVTEKKAPTDESMRLLDEFKKEARDNILSAFKLEKNNVTALVFYEYPSVAGEVQLYLRFNLNGEDYQIKHEMGYFDYAEAKDKFNSNWATGEAFKIWMEILGKAIAVELMKSDGFKSTIVKGFNYGNNA